MTTARIDVSFAALAPELVVTGAALVLLLVAITRGRLQLVMLPVGLVTIGLGAWVAVQGELVPGVVLALLGVAAPVLPVVFPRRQTLVQAWGAGLALAAALVLTFWQVWPIFDGGRLIATSEFAGSFASDGITLFTRLTVYLSALLVVPLGYAYLQERRINRAEVESLILLAAVGMAVLGGANDLVTAFVALEVLSFALYVLAGLARRDRRSQEAGLKYFVTGAVASAVLLYGLALLYVATGTLSIPGIGAGLTSVLVPRAVAVAGLVLVTVGVAFKVALVPFHFWTPDVYQGAPSNVTAFVALEVLSFALYVLASLARRDRRSQEAGVKYFVTGAVASAVLLYGLALLYVATGTLSIPGIGASITSVLVPRGVAMAGLVLVTIGVAFKVALVPFHFWTPDVYQGSPTNVTAFMAAATKAAAFALLLRLYLVAFPGLQAYWVPVLAVLAAATMLYGAFAALAQHDVKRILAYSSITHAGYAIIGVLTLSRAGLSATLLYLLTYAVGTIAAFGVVIAVERRRRGEVTLTNLRGLGRTSPLLAGILSLSLLSLAGLPLTAGFIGKLEVFRAGVSAGLTWLVLIGVLSSLVAASFYLRIAGIMFLEDAPALEGDDDAVSEAMEARMPLLSAGLSSALAIAAALVVVLGVQPQLLLELAGHAGVLLR